MGTGTRADMSQIFLSVGLHYWVYAFPARHCGAAECAQSADDCENTSLFGADCLVNGCGD